MSILKKIFDRNQQEFTEAEPDTIPTIAVVEEAQSVLNEKATAAEPYIAWVKEGRKYDLGALLITQQPGSIPTDILSQGDNWFIFHLLSAVDLTNVKKANAHFSDDLLSSLLNEPIAGQGIFWSSVGGKPYPVAIRTLSFERLYSALDPNYNRPPVETFAAKLRQYFQRVLEETSLAVESEEQRISTNYSNSSNQISTQNINETIRSTRRSSKGKSYPATISMLDEEPLGENPEDDTIDVMEVQERNAINALRNDRIINEKLHNEGVLWGRILYFLRDHLPHTIEEQERKERAKPMVAKALDQILGPKDEGWYSFKNSDGKLCVKAGLNKGSDDDNNKE